MKKIILTSFILFLFLIEVKSQVRITMQKEGGVYTTPCTINGLRLRFIFDTGASNVSISLAEAIFMLKNGYLDENDLHGSSLSQIANGELVKNTTVNLKELEIGGIKLHNVEAVIIHELSAPLLLGQSAIEKLGKIQIENNQLIIVDYKNQNNENACEDAKQLIVDAKKQFFKELYTLAADNFQKAYNLCSESFLCYDFFFLGRSYFLSQNYSLAIKYLEKASDCEKEKETLYDVYFELGQIYRETNDYENAILFFQKALSMTNNNLEISLSNFFIGLSLVKQEKAYEAIEYYKKSLDYELKYLKISENDVKNGRINNVDLGEIYFHLSVTCNFYGKQTTLESYFLKSKDYMIKAALCGYEDAIISCKKYGWRY